MSDKTNDKTIFESAGEYVHSGLQAVGLEKKPAGEKITDGAKEIKTGVKEAVENIASDE